MGKREFKLNLMRKVGEILWIEVNGFIVQERRMVITIIEAWANETNT